MFSLNYVSNYVSILKPHNHKFGLLITNLRLFAYLVSAIEVMTVDSDTLAVLRGYLAAIPKNPTDTRSM